MRRNTDVIGGYTEEQIALRDQILESLTEYETVPVFDFAKQIRTALKDDRVKGFKELTHPLKQALKRIVPPEALLPIDAKPEIFLKSEQAEPKKHRFNFLKKRPASSMDNEAQQEDVKKAKVESKNKFWKPARRKIPEVPKAQSSDPFAALDELVKELEDQQTNITAEIARQKEAQQTQPHLERYKLRLEALDELQQQLVTLIQLYKNYKSDLQNESLSEIDRQALITGRPIIVGLGFDPVYLKLDKADQLLNGKKIGGCSHIVVRVDRVFHKRDPHGTDIEFAADNFNKTLFGQGSAATTLTKVYMGQEVILMQASKAVTGPLLHHALGCDLITLDFLPTQENIREFPIKSSSAYLRFENRLFYVNKVTKEFLEIKIDEEALTKFDAALMPTNEPQPLSDVQLQQIAEITGHVRTLEAIEKKVTKSFSVQVGASTILHPGDGKADNTVFAEEDEVKPPLGDNPLFAEKDKPIEDGDLVNIDQDVNFCDSFVKTKTGKHLPATKNMLYCWQAKMEEPFDTEVREHLKKQSAAMVIGTWLINCEAQNKQYIRLRKEGVLTDQEYEDLKLPIQFVPGTIQRIYRDLAKLIEWCKGEEVTHNQLFKHIDPHLFLFYQHISTFSTDPREAYYKGFDRFLKEVEDLNIPGLGPDELKAYDAKFYDFEDKRCQPVGEAIIELMENVEYSTLRARPIDGNESERNQFLKLLKEFPNLKELVIKDNDFFKRDLIRKLSPWPATLQKLTLINCSNVRAEDLEIIRYYAPNLKLVISNCSELATTVWPVDLAKKFKEFTWKLTDGYDLRYPKPEKGVQLHPIHQVVRDGSMEAVKVVLASGGTLTDKNARGETPFFDALRSAQSTETFLSLLGMGAKYDLAIPRTDGMTVFQFAAERGDLVILQKIAELRDPSVFSEQDHQGLMALQNAAANGQLETVRWLLNRGSDINHRSSKGTALSLAAKNNHFAVVQLLLSQDPNEKLSVIIDSIQAQHPNLANYLRACEYLRKIHSLSAGISLPILERESRTTLKESDLEENANSHAEYGKSAIDDGDMSAAFEHFLQAHALLPNNPGIQLSLGQVAYSLGHFSLAERMLADVLANDDRRYKLAYDSSQACTVLRRELGLREEDFSFDTSKIKGIAKEMEEEFSTQQRLAPTLHPYLRQLLQSKIDKILTEHEEKEAKVLLETLVSKLPIVFGPVAEEILKKKNIALSKKLYGRDEEISIIRGLHNNVCQGACATLLISGEEGSGKTELFKTTLQAVATERGFFVSGKCDQIVRLPFAVISEVLNSLVKVLLKDQSQLAAWREKILAALSPNAHIMLKFIPALKHILDKVAQDETQTATQNDAFLFEQLFMRFVQLFNTEKTPLVIFVDDLQWADAESISLLQQLLLSQQSANKFLMVVGTYRPAECGKDHPLPKMEAVLQSQEKPIVNMRLKKLTRAQIQELVMGELEWVPGKNQNTLSILCDKIFKDTEGNPFYAQQLLLAMRTNRYLVRNSMTKTWQINESQRHLVPTCIADILVERLNNLAKDDQRRLLSFAACLGNSFDLDTLSLVLDLPIADLTVLMTGIVDSGLVFEIEPGRYQFVHDTVQQQARKLDTKTEEERLERHFRIGERLLTKNRGDLSEDEMMMAMEHINKGLRAYEATLDPQKRQEFSSKHLDFASKNLIAGLKAKEATAFSSANQFLECGIRLLQEQQQSWKGTETKQVVASRFRLLRPQKSEPSVAEVKWEANRYELLFAFYKAGIECAYLMGEVERAEKLFAIAMAQAKTDIQKAELYIFKIDHHSRRAEYDQAKIAGKMALNELGVQINTSEGFARKIDLIKRFRKIIRRNPQQTIQKVLEKSTAPPDDSGKQRSFTFAKKKISKAEDTLSDLRNEMIMLIYAKLQEPALLSMDQDLLGLVILRSVELIENPSVKLSKELIGSTYSSYAALLANQHRYDEAVSCDKLSLEYIVQNDIRAAMPLAFFTAAQSTQIWVKPLPKLEEMLNKGRQVALEGQNTSFVPYCTSVELAYKALRRPIPEVKKLLDDNYQIIYRCQNHLITLGTNFIKQYLDVLSDSKAFRAPPNLKYWEETVKKDKHAIQYYTYVFISLIIQGRFDEACKLAKAIKDEVNTSQDTPSIAIIKFYTYLAGLHCSEEGTNPLCSESQMLKDLDTYVRTSTKDNSFSEDEMLTEDENYSEFKKFQCLALAEQMAFRYKSSKIKKGDADCNDTVLALIENNYREAIQLAEKNDWLPVKAIATEFFARFYESIGLSEKASKQWQATIAAYSDLGATAKVEVLQEQIQLKDALIEPDSTLKKDSAGSAAKADSISNTQSRTGSSTPTTPKWQACATDEKLSKLPHLLKTPGVQQSGPQPAPELNISDDSGEGTPSPPRAKHSDEEEVAVKIFVAEKK